MSFERTYVEALVDRSRGSSDTYNADSLISLTIALVQYLWYDGCTLEVSRDLTSKKTGPSLLLIIFLKA